MKRKLLSICLTIAMVLGLCSGITISANAGPIELPMIPGNSSSVPTGLKYTIVNNEVRITDYTGTATNLTIPSKISGKPVTWIDGSAFEGCQSLKSVTIPNSVTTIWSGAFASCENLESITIPDSVTFMGNSIFNCCTNLKTVSLPEGIQTLGNSFFAHCSSLETVTIPSSITTIESNVFENCFSLTEIIIPESVTSIGDFVFTGTGLSAITFQGNFPALSDSSFSYLTTNVYYPADNHTWTEEVMQNYGGDITWIPVGGSTTGDMDGDNSVDNRDVEYLLWYTLYPEDYPITVKADFNGDNTIDNLDVEYLLWHTLFPNEYPLTTF